VHATAYSDDRQVMEYLAGRLREAGLEPLLVAPDLLRREPEGWWRSVAEGQGGEIHGVFRFFPGEWLPNLSGRWRDYFLPGPPACNHPVALLTQSKRVPLVWHRLGVRLPTWRALLPETVDPRRADWEHDEDWVLKPAFGRVGEDVALRRLLSPKEWREIRRDARRHPGAWVAQRRFTSRALESARGQRHVCVGVYTVDGRAAGFYGRVASRPRIDQYAEDVPVLVTRRNT
jgi:glutathionylspermidine synthase